MFSKKKIIHKIAIVINWPRELNYYNFFIDQLGKENIVLIVNDIQSKEIERKNNTENIIKILSKKKIEFTLFSKIYKSYKFKVLISTGLMCPKKISIKSISKYLYAKTIGFFLEITRVNNLIKKFMGISLSAGGFQSTIYEEWFPEKKIGITTVFFPRGLDLRLKYFPSEKFKNIFDIFLCYGLFDSNLIKKKFKKSINYIIGMPRYDIELDQKKNKREIYKEFKLDDKKKLIFWCPTYIEESGETSKNIELWLNKFSNLNKDYNIIIRPHPKNLVVDRTIKEKIIFKNIYVDDRLERNLNNLYKAADLVIVDFGASALTSIYLKKKMLFLELPTEYSYIKRLIKTCSMDFEIRNYIDKTLIINLNNESFKKQITEAIENQNNEISSNLKKRFFGEKDNTLSLKTLMDKLKGEIKND